MAFWFIFQFHIDAFKLAIRLLNSFFQREMSNNVSGKTINIIHNDSISAAMKRNVIQQRLNTWPFNNPARYTLVSKYLRNMITFKIRVITTAFFLTLKPIPFAYLP